jgi:adenylate cyclase
MSEESSESQAKDPTNDPLSAVNRAPNGASGNALGAAAQVLTRHPVTQLRFFAQLKHRNVVRVGILYLVAAWLVLEPVHVIFHMLEVPIWANQLVIILMAIGFLAVLLFAWVYEMTPEGLKLTTEVEPSRSIRTLTGRRLDRAITIVLVVGIAYLLIDKFWISQHVATEHAAAPEVSASHSAPTATAIVEKSIAVLSFTDMSEKKDQEYFADGMAEEITDLLARIPEIRVMSRTSSFRFKGHNDDLRTVGASLGVSYVLEGSVRKAGDHVRVTAQLIDVSDGSHRWSGSYDEDLVDVLKVQDQISWGLVRALQVSMGADESGLRPPLKSADAYALYLRGRQAFNEYDKAGYDQAASYFQQAMQLDPESAVAPAWLALVNFQLAAYGLVRADTGFVEARQDAERALALDPHSELAAATLGCIYLIRDWNWAAGTTELDRALALAPGSARILLLHSMSPLALGNWEAALRDLNASVALDPLLPAAHYLLANAQVATGHWSEAEAEINRALDIAPTYTLAHFTLAEVLLFKGERQAALAQIALEPVEAAKWAGRAAIYHAMGQNAESDAALKKLTELAPESNSAYFIACAQAYRGERDAAFVWLDRALMQKEPALFRIKSSAYLNSLKGDPRFKAFLRKMQLPE